MGRQLTQHVLERETEAFRGSGGISQENRGLGFRPAFFDQITRRIYPSLFADGRPAPFHLIDGLPSDAIEDRDLSGRPILARAGVIAGFVRDGRFYTREEAAACAGT
jgi:hypothetical protein